MSNLDNNHELSPTLQPTLGSLAFTVNYTLSAKKVLTATCVFNDQKKQRRFLLQIKAYMKWRGQLKATGPL